MKIETIFGHLLIGKPLTAQIELKIAKSSKAWILEEMITRLFEFQYRYKWKKEYSPNVESGAMVVMKEDNTQVLQKRTRLTRAMMGYTKSLETTNSQTNIAT